MDRRRDARPRPLRDLHRALRRTRHRRDGATRPLPESLRGPLPRGGRDAGRLLILRRGHIVYLWRDADHFAELPGVSESARGPPPERRRARNRMRANGQPPTAVRMLRTCSSTWLIRMLVTIC